MARYIDAEVAENILLHTMAGTGYQSRAINSLDFVATANVEKVVRCKNCKFRYSTTCFAKHETSENDFCSCGARMDGGKEYAEIH